MADVTLHSRRQFRANTQAGATLFEVLVVIVIVGILTAMAAPNFSSFIANGRISSATNDLISDLMLARSMAATNGHHAVVCASTNGTSCSTTVLDWTVGRIVFIDMNSNGIYDAGDILIKHTTTGLTGATITMTGFPNTYIAFSSYGGMAPLGTGQFKLCVTGATQCRQISIGINGRALSTKV
jgi:type IV fimbrial biogenesis protein FimT